ANKGATGTDVSGGNNIINQNGKLVVDSFSTGIKVTGDANQLNLTSNEMTVTGEQANGVIVSGAANVVNMIGTMNVNTSATGINISGTSADVKLSGTVNVEANAEDSISQSLRFDKGTGYRGVVVSSENTSAQNATNVLVEGSINIKDNRTDPMAYPNSPTDVVPYGRDMTGLDVSGAYNNVTVTGVISLEATPYNSKLVNDSTIKGNDNDYDDHLIGLNVSGTNNNVVVEGGINLNSTTETSDGVTPPDMVGIAVAGAGNQVTISGASSLISKSASGSFMQFSSVADGSSLVLETDSTLTIAPQGNGNKNQEVGGRIIQVKDANSKFVNKGEINSTSSGGLPHLIVESQSGATSENSGAMTLNILPMNFPWGYSGVVLAATDIGSHVSNTGEITVINNKKANDFKYMTDVAYNPMSAPRSGGWHFAAGISVISGATGSNSGTITATGGNTWALGANNKGTIINETGGQIVHNANSETQDLTIQCTVEKPCLAAMGGGVVTAHEATATNKGTITINDSGVGMYADSGTVINKGTINLENTTTPVSGTPLIGMAATYGGTVINDTTGVININAGNGQAFYTNGTGGTIYNSGTVNLNASGASMGSTPTASAPDAVQHVSGYVLGTHADGSAGTLNAGNNALALGSVSV
ncbi:TPA: beta strand repeat-containing protein, partial [Citrobacter braakii]